jgi:hypothetical protein
MLGIYQELTFAGSPAVGDPVYVDDTGAVSLTAGTFSRVIGYAGVASGGFYRLFVNGIKAREAPAAAEETVASGALDPDILHSDIDVTGTQAYTLADGNVIGFSKTIRVTVAASTPDGTLTPTSLADGTSIDLDAVGEELTLMWNGTNWRVTSIAGATITP